MDIPLWLGKNSRHLYLASQHGYVLSNKSKDELSRNHGYSKHSNQ